MSLNKLAALKINSIEFKDLSIGYSEADLFVNNVSCSLPMDEIVHIKGDRGVGKSTFLRILAGLSEPHSGEYIINNESVSDMSFEQFLKYRLRIGYSFEYGGLIHNMTVFENLMLPLQYHNLIPNKQAKQRVLQYMDEFELLSVKNKRPSFIPGSMRKEVCVLRAFLLDPQILILDSPTTGMNIENKKRLKQLIWAKKEQGELRHVYIVSDDVSFTENLITSEFLLDWNTADVA